MDKAIGTEYKNELERIAFLRNNCDKVSEESYMKQFDKEELDSMKTKLSNLCIEIDDIETEKKLVNDGFKDQLKPIINEKAKLLGNLKNKAELVNEQCFIFIDTEDKMVGTYNKDGILVSSRPAMASEMQTTIHQEFRKTGTND
jgi:hypothetical protein